MGNAEMKTTYCRICEAGCGLKVLVKDNRIESIEPDKDHPVTKGFACSKGLRFSEIQHSPDRLKYPLKRVDGKFHRISWQQALSEIGAKVRKLLDEKGPDSIAAYVGNGAGFSTSHTLFLQGFFSGTGSINTYSPNAQDCANKLATDERMYGFPLLHAIPDIDRTECLIVLGGNPEISKMSFIGISNAMEHIRAIEERGGKVFFIDPRCTESAKRSGEHVFIRPDTDVFFLLTFLNELIRTGGIEQERIDAFMKGYETLVEVAQPWTPDRLEAVTGISGEKLKELVKCYREANAAALYHSTGVNQGSRGTLASWILEAINAISGNLDRFGGTLIGRGMIDFAGMGAKAGFGMRKDRTRVSNCPSVIDSFPGGVLAEEILTPGEGQIRAFFVSGGNPLHSLPNTEHLREAFEDLELLVSIDIFRNETAELAHYVLPGVSMLQRPDIPFIFQSLCGMQAVPYLQYTDRVLDPEYEQREESWIYRELTRTSGLKLFGSSVANAIFSTNRFLSFIPGLGSILSLTPERLIGLMLAPVKGISLRKLRKNPQGLHLEPHQENDFLGKRVQTEDGRVNLAPADLVEGAKALEAEYDREVKNRDTLKLISKRERFTHNSWWTNAPSVVKGDRNTNYVYMQPEDAADRQISDGDWVEVATDVAKLCLPVKLTEDVMKGVIAVPHGWGHAEAEGLSVASKTEGANVNLLAKDGGSNLEEYSGMAQLTAFAVEVSKVDPPASTSN